jgi:hypothetical protein
MDPIFDIFAKDGKEDVSLIKSAVDFDIRADMLGKSMLDVLCS